MNAARCSPLSLLLLFVSEFGTGCAGNLDGNWDGSTQGAGEPSAACITAKPSSRTTQSVGGTGPQRLANGDIILPRADPSAGHTRIAANMSNEGAPPKLFPDGVIHYQVRGDVDAVEVRAAMDAWESRWVGTQSAPRFVECTGTCDYTVFIDENRGYPECGSSAVGQEPALPGSAYQIVYLPGRKDSRCRDIQRTARHEIGHLLGLFHEQQRTDRDAYIRVSGCAPELSPEQLATDFGTAEGRPYGRYDFRSIMHYPGSTEGYPTITLANGQPLPPYTGTTSDISPGDVAAVLSLYVPGVGTPSYLGGEASLGAATPAAAAGPGGKWVALRDSNDHLHLRSRTAACGGWCAWEDTGFLADASPALAYAPERGLITIARRDDRLCLRDETGQTSCPLEAPAGYRFSAHDAPSLATAAGGALVVLARTEQHTGGGGLFVTVGRRAEAFGAWTQLSHDATGSAAVVAHELDTFDAFWLSSVDGGLHTQQPRRWDFPEGTRPAVGIPYRTGVALASSKPGRFELFVLGNDDLIWSLRGENGHWGHWSVRGGPARSLPAVAALPESNTELFYAGPLGPTLEVAPYAFDPLKLDAGIWSESLGSEIPL